MKTSLHSVDHAALRVNQAVLIGLNILAFVINGPWLAGFIALVMLAGTLLGMPGFAILYRYVLKPLGWVKPDILQDNPEPHRFAQGLGGVFMSGGTLALLAGLPILGWGLVWLVTALAALNLFAGFCAGCMVYYWFSRLNVPGFSKSPPAGALPGMRPKASVSHE